MKIPLPPSQSGATHEASLTIIDKDGGIVVPTVPSFTDPYAERQWAKEHMAAAFRIFGRNGYGLGVSGHISLRDPVNATHIWFNPFAKHFSTICARDLVLVDENGHVIEGGSQQCVNAAGFWIHSELHKVRPDVNAACHAHSPHGVAYSVFGKPLEMITQDVCYFHNRHSVYQNFGGIVLAAEEGRRIAAALGPTNHSLILRNHGLLTTGKTVDEAAFLFLMMERCCGVQLAVEAAAAAGAMEKHYIGSTEAEFTALSGNDRDALYLDFQTEYSLVMQDTGGSFKQ